MFPKRLARLPWREIDGRAVVIQTQRGEVHEFDESATVLWKSLDGARGLDDLARELTECFDVDFETARVDAQLFLGELEAKGLIENGNS